jgi:hypothetical protein
MQRGVSFGYYPRYALTSDGLIYASTERPEFAILELDPAASAGRTVRIVRRTDVAAVRVAEVRDRYVEWVGQLSADDPSARKDAMSRARASLDVLPSEHVVPYVDEIMLDSEKRIWQRDRLMGWEPDSTSRTWTVYSVDGALARIVIPANFRITQIEADHVIGVTRDDADVQFVTIYRLLR